MKINFDQIINRYDTSCKRWDLMRKQYNDNDIISLGIADMDFPAPPEVAEAIKQRLAHPCFGYTYPIDSLLETIVHFFQTSYQWIIEKEWIVLFPDATTSLYYLLWGIDSEKKKIILQPPVFGPFTDDIKHARYEPISNPLIFENQEYRMDFDHLNDLFKNNMDIRALLLCNPQNPIGRVWTKEELSQLGEICLKNKCLIISDELHSDLILRGYKHTPIGSINKEFEKNSITSISPGKGFNIAGLKISALIIPDNDLRKNIISASHGLTPSILSMVAYEAAIKAGYEYYSNLISEHLTDTFEFIDNFLKTRIPTLNLIKPQATFLAWIDMNKLNMSQEQMHEFMIKKAQLHITYGHTFGQGGQGFGRFNIALHDSLLKKAFSRLEKSINELPA